MKGPQTSGSSQLTICDLYARLQQVLERSSRSKVDNLTRPQAVVRNTQVTGDVSGAPSVERSMQSLSPRGVVDHGIYPASSKALQRSSEEPISPSNYSLATTPHSPQSSTCLP